MSESEIKDAAPVLLGRNIFPYSLRDVSKTLTQSDVNGRNKLCRFLRQEGIFENSGPVKLYLDLGYFKINYRYTTTGYYAGVTSVSAVGLEFITNLVTEKLGEPVTPSKKSQSRKPGQLTNINFLLR
ncbi:hypothetical protein [Dyadobacter frigoris]|uniref:Uncharacterized protein n=1 Tax=Dyadobacter frigoris TaxID=2576211 RepID=A0A4U6DHH5_9BACT|nr:hypothetical protein [Dyadobacter frigoris]TKT94164.1 hypothetical protein FDK13_02840 [Dyadobacter frigoris]